MEDKKMNRHQIYKIIMLIVLTAFITFMITSLSLYTYYSNNKLTSNSTMLSTVNTSSIENYINKLRKIIDNNYLWADNIDETKLKESAIAGYVEGLGDKYTEYISKEDMKEFKEEINGSFVGIGIYMVADEEKGIIIYYPIPESPAEKVGIKAGDVIKKVDGVEYGYDDFSIIADHIKGEEGTKVNIVVERDGKEKEFEITRAKITTNPITTKILEKNIGYINVPSFDSEVSENFKIKVEKLIEDGAKTLIIDLRNNGGGIVDESTNIADYFLEKGKIIITTKDKNNNEEVTKSENDAIFNMPLIVLANKNSASASEILIGALKDNNRATIIGTKTYGKGVIQTVLSLSDGSGIKITTAEYHTPNGTEINGKGIEPTIKVNLPDDVKNVYSVNEDEDTQLKKAIEELKK